MAHQLLIITLLSDDQPGIVKSVADVIGRHHGNWLESKMSQLAGKFAGILKISIDAQHIEELTQSLHKLKASGIQILIDSATDLENTPRKMLTFELVGADRQGIVSEISQAFMEQNINIDELETHCSSMPWSGDPLFEATGVLLAPTNVDKEQLLDKLDVIENSLGVDISLNEQL